MSKAAANIGPAFEIIGDSSDRDAWLDLRRTGIGGSDAPAILGLVGWASPASVQADKWNLLEEPDQAEHLKWGQRLEGVILEAFAEEIGHPVDRYGLLIRSTEHPFMLCTPDGVFTKDGTRYYVQAKNTMMASAWEEDVPDHVKVQVQHEMAVTGAEACYVAALVFGNRLRWARVERDQSFIEDVLIPAEREFWRLVEAREPAPPDASEHTRKALEKLYPEDSGEMVVLDGSFTDLHVERLELLDRQKATKRRLQEIGNTFRHAMGSATFAQLQNGVIYSLRTQTRKEHMVKESTFRVLRQAGKR